MLYVDILLPVEFPGSLKIYQEEKQELYMFDHLTRFAVYRHTSMPHLLMKDDKSQWYMAIQWKLSSFGDLKWCRQVYRPSYATQDIQFKLIDYLKEAQLKSSLSDFDKAFVHTSLFVKQLSDVSVETQLQLANADGPDDPAILPHIHYIENSYEGKYTRFLSGFETNSIATVTENQSYFEFIHLPNVSLLYLQYFAYFQQYGTVPSRQMMARLLGNLWASTQAFNTDWNPSLLLVDQITTKLS